MCIDEKVQSYFADGRTDMLKYVPKNAKTILDVGCGEGLFGANIKSAMPVEVWGIELFSDAAQKAKAKLDRVLQCNVEFDSLELPQAHFDCIVFNDVLEHLNNPWGVLQTIKQYLKPDGHVIASIPNIRYWESLKSLVLKKEFEYQKHGVMDKTHLRFFTINSIPHMFNKSGYDVVEINGINPISYSWKFNLLNTFLLNCIEDMRYQQFACVAKISTP